MIVREVFSISNLVQMTINRKGNTIGVLHNIFGLALIAVLTFQCAQDSPPLKIKKGSHIILIGNNLCSRMMNFGYFETELRSESVV